MEGFVFRSLVDDCIDLVSTRSVRMLKGMFDSGQKFGSS